VLAATAAWLSETVRVELSGEASLAAKGTYKPDHGSEASVAKRKTHSMKNNEIAPPPDIDLDVWFPARHPIPTSCLKCQ